MGICRQISRRRKIKRNLPVLACLGCIMVYYTVTWPEEQIEEKPQTDLIISSYIKGGGDLVGEVLGRRENTFYTYEPLFVKSMWNYYKTYTTKCKILEKACVQTDNSSVQAAVDLLTSTFSCKTFSMVEQYYHPRWDNGGLPWQMFRQCLSDGRGSVFCDQITKSSCAHASNRVVKTNRVSVHLLGGLLKTYNNIKAIHIFRDPRGIISSRMKTSWYPEINSPKDMKSSAEALCHRIEDDIDEGMKLVQIYPKRFKMILFEDFQANIDHAVRQLLQYFNLQYSDKDRAKVEAVMKVVEAQQFGADKESNVLDLPVNRVDSNETLINPFDWRGSLDIASVRIIDEACGGLYQKLGYNVYKNEDKLRDVQGWPSFTAGGIPLL